VIWVYHDIIVLYYCILLLFYALEIEVRLYKVVVVVDIRGEIQVLGTI
jgi:hypothetical protein